MFVRTSTETVLLRKATHPSDFFFSISVGKKNKNIHRVGGGERKIPEGKRRCCDEGAARSHTPFPFTRRVLLVQDGSVPFWNTSFLNGAVVKQCIVGQECLILLSFFDCLLLKISLYCSWYCGVYITRTVSVVICFWAVSLPFVALLVI